MMVEDFATLQLESSGQLAVDMDLNKLAEAAVGHALYSKFCNDMHKVFKYTLMATKSVENMYEQVMTAAATMNINMFKNFFDPCWWINGFACPTLVEGLFLGLDAAFFATTGRRSRDS